MLLNFTSLCFYYSLYDVFVTKLLHFNHFFKGGFIMSTKKNNNIKLDDNSHVSEIIKEKLTELLEPSETTSKDSFIPLFETEEQKDENTNLSQQQSAPAQPKTTANGIEQNVTEEDFEHVLKNDERERELHSEGYVYINVIETFVKEIIADYMTQYGSCTCNHCIIDTMALALTNLPSKYIVAKKGNLSPLLHVYRKKYFTEISTEVLKACLTVSKSPHHSK